jgi:hypothetical protein
MMNASMQVERANQNIPFYRLGPELIMMIARHLLPRHFYKLMQTSKYVKNTIDTEEYWERVALYYVFRNFEITEIMYCDDKDRIFPKLSGLYYLVNLEHGYNKTMDIIVARVRDIMGRDYDDDGSWKPLVNAPIAMLVRAGEREMCNGLGWGFGMSTIRFYKEHPAVTMKDVAKREVDLNMVHDTPSRRKLRKFQHKMDDDTYFSRKDKTRFMKDFETIMDDLWDGKPCEVNFGDVSFTVGDF